MSFDPVIASIRFGMGRSPVVPDPDSVADMLEMLTGPDLAAEAHPIPGLASVVPSIGMFRLANRARNAAKGTDRFEAASQAVRDLRDDALQVGVANAISTFARAITTRDGLRERLTAFWANHFTVVARQGTTRHLVTPFVQDVIRTNLTGRFADMLKDAVTHPMMLSYLDQVRSMGPNSQAASRRNGGLNENLAREVLELHTIGVNASYSQTDVTELAELFTGLSVTGEGRFEFRPAFAEPGAETVLGVAYGGEEARLEDIFAVLDDIASRPATAAHLSRKLAVHFVADDPPAEMVEAIEATWRATDGDLKAVTETMLSHPASWDSQPRKVKPPQQFIMSVLRALNVDPQMIRRLERRDLRRAFDQPLLEMGQPWERPPGPDGWPEAAEAWITPQGMASRITWAMAAPEALQPDLPDPRAFAEIALGPEAPQPVRFAAGAAETVPEGIGVILASAAFQRR